MGDDSKIIVGEGGTSFVGRDAVRLYQATVLRSSLKLLSKGIKPTRGATLTRTLKLIGSYTGQTYKRTEAVRAIDDITVWIETMKSAMPVERREA